ncbi:MULTISPECIES: response regulator [Curvivirga]|uniref:response regulator n=1 Tax=Curvivirga TaxID=2856846 RepID=UPI0012BB65E1|nr:response regulator [Curvivirga aplysinae]MTI08570.1 response regulator [Curvivirga aplysinae]
MKTCLVVDDSRVIRMVARKILEELNFNVVEAEDGQQALNACKDSMPECVLLDWNMPNMNGLEFMLEMRKLPTGQDVIVVFCTTENDMDHIQEAVAAGANEYIMKPFDSEIIQSKFTQVGLI